MIHWSHQAIEQRPTLVVEYADFQDFVPWRTQSSGFCIEIERYLLLSVLNIRPTWNL
jgi:hypothetical protein